MRLLATPDVARGLEYDEETCDAMGTLMQWVVPEVIRLVKSPELFSCRNIYRLFVQQAFDCLVSLKATAYVFEQGEKKSDCQMDILQTTDYLHKFRAYQFSVDDYEHPWNHFLFGKPIIAHHPVPLDPTCLTAHTFMSGGVRLSIMWELYCHRSRIGVSRVSRVHN